jgi:hypothetical protein
MNKTINPKARQLIENMGFVQTGKTDHYEKMVNGIHFIIWYSRGNDKYYFEVFSTRGLCREHIAVYALPYVALKRYLKNTML